MKCPTCGYIGFETSDRCRNCGYDFGLANQAPPAPELSLHADEMEGALKELDIRNASPDAGGQACDRRAPGKNIGRRSRSRTSTRSCRISIASWAGPSRLPTCPCLTTSLASAPLVDGGAAPRRPLAVRRTTPDPTRLRTKPIRHQAPAPRALELPLPDDRESPSRCPSRMSQPPMAAEVSRRAPAPPWAGRGVGPVHPRRHRFGGGVLHAYACAGSPPPRSPCCRRFRSGAFFLLVNGGYLASFTAAGGQTIGKMAFGLKVVGHADLPVSAGLSVVRALGCLASVASLGLGFLPALLGDGGRAIEDRLADTRVVRVSAA